MPLAHMMYAINDTIHDRKIVFYYVRVLEYTLHVFVERVINNAMADEFTTNQDLIDCVIGHEVTASTKVHEEDWEQHFDVDR